MLAGEGYSSILDIDAEMRKIRDNLPPFYRYDGVSEKSKEVKALHATRPWLELQRILISEWLHHRSLQMHRFFLSRGYKNPKYKLSLDRSIEGARGVVSFQ